MSSESQPSPQVFLVTGANKGIGYEVVKKLSAKQHSDLILLGSRDRKRGEDALVQLGSPANIKLLVLDTASEESIKHAKEEIEAKHGGYLDVLINNAAIVQSSQSVNLLKEIFATNFYGVKQMVDIMSPLLRDHGRIVNVSSGLGAGAMRNCSEELKAKFLNPELTETQLEQLFAPLFQAVEEETDLRTTGFSSRSKKDNWFYYSVSKLGVNVLTRIEARDWSEKYPGKNVIISAVCPGFCATDLTHNAKSARSSLLGADSILHAVHTPNLENGQFWRDGNRLPIDQD